MLLVQQFLETHNFMQLQEQHGVYASFSKSGHKFSLNYDQIEAKENDPLAQECRGLILSSIDGKPFSHSQEDGDPYRKTLLSLVIPGKTKILAFPMKRFFNHGQGSAAEINWSDPKLAVLEKLDGTLCIVYYDWVIKQWCVATRSVSEADLLMDNGLFTFRTLFEKALKETVGQKQHWIDFDYFCRGNLSPNFTYCFELTTPYNRIVVYYPDNRVTFLAARHMPNLLELSLDDERVHLLTKIVPAVQAHTYTTLDELLTWVSSLNPMEHEGVVVRDANFNRIKVKNAAYVAYNKVRDTLAASPRNCLELILLGKDDDAASFLPQEIQANLFSLKDKFILWLKEQENLAQIIIEEAQSIAPDKKTFALTVQKYKPDMPSAMFAIYDSKANSIRSFIDNNRKEGTWSASFLDKILSYI
jgi:hypothetical protein